MQRGKMTRTPLAPRRNSRWQYNTFIVIIIFIIIFKVAIHLSSSSSSSSSILTWCIIINFHHSKKQENPECMMKIDCGKWSLWWWWQGLQCSLSCKHEREHEISCRNRTAAAFCSKIGFTNSNLQAKLNRAWFSASRYVLKCDRGEFIHLYWIEERWYNIGDGEVWLPQKLASRFAVNLYGRVNCCKN